jgi:hypothetical protein
MTERHTLIAFCAILAAICYLATVAAILAWQQRYAEALGFGGLTTGLVGVIGTFRPQPRKETGNTVENADTVNQGAPS